MKKVIAVQIQYDVVADQIILSAPMDTQEEKNATLRALATAISAAVAYKPPLIMTPPPLVTGPQLIKPGIA